MSSGFNNMEVIEKLRRGCSCSNMGPESRLEHAEFGVGDEGRERTSGNGPSKKLDCEVQAEGPGVAGQGRG